MCSFRALATVFYIDAGKIFFTEEAALRAVFSCSCIMACMQKEVSVVISNRDEFPNQMFTIQNIINDLETFLEPDQFEIILVDNGSIDKRNYQFIQERGWYYHRTVRILHDPIAGNVTARNKGAAIAKGKYLFFSDSHMSYKYGTFKNAIETIDKTGGMVHGAVQWLGGYEPSPHSHQYSIKIGEKLWGTWNGVCISNTESFYIPASGHCFLGVTRKQFLDFGGYNDYFRCYGGGELYLDMKWWMLGSSVACDPRCVGYHLSAGRGYSYHNNDLIHNMILLGFALGADALAERIYIRYMDKQGIQPETLEKMYNDAVRESISDREYLSDVNATSFYDVLRDRPWDRLNEREHGKSQSFISIFDRTWVDNLGERASAYFDASELQKDFDRYVKEHMSDCIYKGS